MRLIHTTTLKQEEFFESQLPKYAILSHTWGNDEVSLKRFHEDGQREGPGWAKILQCCRIAEAVGLEWAWCDTCCIDKTSSAELSETINSTLELTLLPLLMLIPAQACIVGIGTPRCALRSWKTSKPDRTITLTWRTC